MNGSLIWKQRFDDLVEGAELDGNLRGVLLESGKRTVVSNWRSGRIWTMGERWPPRWSSALNTTSPLTPGRHKGFTAWLSHVKGCREPGPEHRRHSARATTATSTARTVLGDRIEGNKMVLRNGRCNDDARCSSKRERIPRRGPDAVKERFWKNLSIEL